MPTHTAVISLGSNIHPRQNISRARALLRQQYTIIRESRFIRTKPIGDTNQPDFINGTVLLETQSNLPSLKKSLKALEKSLKRKRAANKFAPRTIDLDIVVWDNRIIDPDYYSRNFLRDSVLSLLPLLEK